MIPGRRFLLSAHSISAIPPAAVITERNGRLCEWRDLSQRSRAEAENKAAESAGEKASVRGKYWRPDLNRSEWNLLNRRLEEEIESSGQYLDESTKWLYADEKGVQVFALYGIGDGTDATPLYAVGGKRAKQIADDLRMMEDAYEKTDGGRGAVDSWIESIRRAKGSRNGNRSTDGNGRTAVQNDGLHGGSSGSDGRGAAERSSENQRGVKDQFSLREPVEETRDLLALHNMTADNLHGALEPVRQPKEFSKFGNGALQQLVSEVGVQELARFNAQRQERLAVLDNVHSG